MWFSETLTLKQNDAILIRECCKNERHHTPSFGERSKGSFGCFACGCLFARFFGPQFCTWEVYRRIINVRNVFLPSCCWFWTILFPVYLLLVVIFALFRSLLCSAHATEDAGRERTQKIKSHEVCLFVFSLYVLHFCVSRSLIASYRYPTELRRHTSVSYLLWRYVCLLSNVYVWAHAHIHIQFSSRRHFQHRSWRFHFDFTNITEHGT